MNAKAENIAHETAIAEYAKSAVAEYNATEAALAELRHKYASVLFPDLHTGKGMKAATEARAELRALRVNLEKKRVEIKEPALEHCRQIDAEAKRIKGEIEALEDPIDAQIKAEEERKEAAKAEAARIEAERVASLAKLVNEISSAPLFCAGLSVAKHQEVIARVEAIDVTLEVYQERTGEAQQLRDQVLAQLADMLARAEAQEAEQARLKAEAEALAKRQAEQAEIERKARVERERLEAEQAERLRADRAKREQEEAAERARVAAERKAEQDRIDEKRRKEQAEFDRQRAEQAAEFAKQQAALREQQEAVAAQQRAIDEARQQEEARKAKEAQEQADKIARDNAAAVAIAETIDAQAAELADCIGPVGDEMASDLQELLYPKRTLAQLAQIVADSEGWTVEQAHDAIVAAVRAEDDAFYDQEFYVGN